MLPVSAILNVSAYRFVALPEPCEWCEAIDARLRAGGAARSDPTMIKGTVLLAHEGINLVLAGSSEPMRDFFGWLDSQPVFAGMSQKESWSDGVPFDKLVVKVKPEIIRMNMPTIRPAAQRAPAVDAPTLARWLAQGHDDDGRQVVMLDTRNDFEVDAGRFVGSIDWRLARFSDFPGALASGLHDLRGKTVVTYCTGGIRCEKAALLMIESGHSQVLQLEDGILGYLASQGRGHFDGHCVVFDRRGALDASLWSVHASQARETIVGPD